MLTPGLVPGRRAEAVSRVHCVHGDVRWGVYSVLIARRAQRTLLMGETRPDADPGVGPWPQDRGFI